MKINKSNAIFKHIFVYLSENIFYIKDIVNNSDFAQSTTHDSIFKLERAGLIVPLEKGFEKTSAVSRQITQKGLELGYAEIISWLPNDVQNLQKIKTSIDERIKTLV